MLYQRAKVKTGDWCLATNTSDQTMGVKLIQGAYVYNDSYMDEWLLNPISSSIILEPQQTSVWCWVACARMMSSKYQIPQISQAAAAVKIKLTAKTLNPTQQQITESSTRDPNTTDDDITGNGADIEAAIEYLLGVETSYSAWQKIYTESTLRSLLDAGNYVVLRRGKYNANKERTNGHATVVIGYRFDNTSGIYLYEIYDPWKPNIGSTYERSYSSICDGSNRPYAGDPQNDNSIWDGVVTFEIGNYNNTIDWLGV